MSRGAILLGLLALLPLAGCRREAPPSLLLVTIDTLRADHLPTYGYPRPTAPSLDALARRGVHFTSAMAAVPETGPSCATLLTGRWPTELSVRGNGRPLPPGAPTLAEILSGAGYRTAAFVSGYPLIRRLSGLDRGFGHYDDTLPDPRGGAANVQRSAARTTDAVLAWLRGAGEGPFFIWLHYYDVHGDYDPGLPYDSLFRDGPPGPYLPLERIPAYQRRGASTDAADYIARYDGEIRRVDDQIQRLLEDLGGRGLLARTVVAVTSDHGESLTEHGYFFDHGNELYAPSLHVPLILAGPGIPATGAALDGVARLPDLFPTLLELLGQTAPSPLPSRSLVPALGGAPLPGADAFAEARFQPYRPLTPGADVGPKLAARDDRFSAILRLDGPRLELYDLAADPGEERDLLAGRADAAAAHLRTGLDAALRARLAATSAPQPAPPVFSPELRRLAEGLAAGGGP